MLLPLLVSILIVVGAPYVGQLRGELQSAFPEHYTWIISGIVATSTLSAVVSAVVQLRRSQSGSSRAESGSLSMRTRYTLIAAAIVVGVAYARTVRTGEPQVDMVEAFHFVEYGLVAYVFYRAWRRRPDISGVLLAACASLSVAVADEWTQWFVPARVGELHDVGLNAVAVGCGLLVSIAARPPLSLEVPRHRGSRIMLGAVISALIVVVAGFVDRVHLGYEVQEGRSATFRSRYDARALAAAAANRPARWEASPPAVRGFTHEDHYLSEGEWHVARRNRAIGAGDWSAALGEDAILERFYSPVLDRLGHLSREQRTEIELNIPRTGGTPYVSDAVPYPIYTVRRSRFWSVTLLLTVGILWLFARF
jgi:VanZ family protein